MPTPIDRRRITIQRLALARFDFMDAKELFDYLAADFRPNHPRFHGLMTAAVVIYARPFTQNQDVGALGAEIADFGDPRSNALHADILRDRNQTKAHSDGEACRVSVLPRGTRMSGGQIVGDTTVMVRRLTPNPPMLRRLSRMAQTLVERVTPQIDALVDAVYPPPLPDREFDVLGADGI